MKFDTSPELESFEETLIVDHAKEQAAKLRSRILIGVLAIIALSLAVYNFAGSAIAVQLAGKGAITGRIVNEAGQPAQASIFVMGVDREVFTDANGYFTYEGVPNGERSLIVANEESGEEIIVQVTTATITDIGTFTFIPEVMDE